MLRPAAVSAAAALWLLAVLGLGLSFPDEATTETGFTHCSHSFYRQMPPQGSSVGPLRPFCHMQPGGQSFATLYKPTCGSAVYSAFHLSKELTDATEEDGAEPVSKEEESIKVVVPALLKGDSDEPQVSPLASHLQQWDSAVTTLVQSSIAPRCHTSGGDLYVLIGAGRLGAVGDEAEDCQTRLLWSAVCCAVPGGQGSFSLAFIRETEGEDRQITVEELVDMLGVTELFSEGCRGDVQTVEVLASQGEVQSESVVASGAAAAEDTKTEEVDADNGDQTPEEEGSEPTVSSSKNQVTTKEKPDVAESAKTAQVTTESGSDESVVVSLSEGNTAEAQTVAEVSEGSETVEDQETDDNSTSTLLYILSTTLSILKAPVDPVVSRVTQLPGQSAPPSKWNEVCLAGGIYFGFITFSQVTYVFQEDLGVLSALPGDIYSVLHLLTSDMLSWTGSAADLLLSVGEACFSRIYFCTSSMGEALWNSCYTGITGMGTLAGDTVGIFGDVLDNTWWVTKFFGGRLVEQSGDYVGSVVGELGGQAGAVGGGLRKLAWRSGNGVGNVFRCGEWIVMFIWDMVTGAVKEAFGEDSVRNEKTIEMSE